MQVVGWILSKKIFTYSFLIFGGLPAGLLGSFVISRLIMSSQLGDIDRQDGKRARTISEEGRAANRDLNLKLDAVRSLKSKLVY